MSALERAHYFHRMDFSVIAVPKGSPFALAGWQAYREHRSTEEDLRGWFHPGSTHELGIVTGRISQLAVVRVVDWLTPWFRSTFAPAVGEARWQGGVDFYFSCWRYFQNDLAPQMGRNAITVLHEKDWVYAPGSRSPSGFEFNSITEFSIKQTRRGLPLFDPDWMKQFHEENIEFKKMLAQSRRRAT